MANLRPNSNYLLVGAGQLGSRHLQALATLEAHTIYVVEPNAQAASLAKERFQQIPAHAGKKLVFTDFAELTKEEHAISAAIIATLSNNRLAVLEEVLSLGVKYVLCEKVAFQSVAEYQQARVLMKKHQARVHVNHIYRYIPIYNEIRNYVSKHNKPLNITYKAGNIGMGCTYIHVLDLFAFLTDRPVEAVEAHIEKPLLPCKRGADFIEFTGAARATTAQGDMLEVEFLNVHQDAPIIRFQCGDLDITVDEAKDAWTQSGSTKPLEMPISSRLTARLMPEILSGQSRLPTLEEAFPLNMLMLNAFNHSLHGSCDDVTQCPIT